MKIKHLIGFSLIEILVSLFIIMVLVSSVYALINYSLQITADNKNYVQAISIANQKLEEIRGLPYDSVGNLGGIPGGIIENDEIILRNGTFNVSTTITFYDDSYDGLLEDENDDFIDYKIATVRVGWRSKNIVKNITMSSKIISPTQEIPEGWGLLKIFIQDSSGNAVTNAIVNIKNSNLNPAIDVDYSTEDTNVLRIPVFPSDSYEITVSKNGYSDDKTYAISETNPEPTKPNLSVSIGEKEEATFRIDPIGKFNIRTLRANLPQSHIVNSNIFNQLSPAVDSCNDYSYFVWKDSGDNLIYLQKFDLNGSRQWVDDVDVALSGLNESPDIKIIKDSNLVTCFTKQAIDYKNVYISFLDSSGLSLYGPNEIDSTITNQTNCKLSYSYFASSTIVVWEDERNFNDSLGDIYMKIYDENFLSYSSIRVNSGVLFSQHNPDVAVDSNGNIYVVWTDNRNNGDEDIYMQKFNSSGVKQWNDGDKIVNLGIEHNQYSPKIAIDNNDKIYIIWTDQKNGDEDIYMQKFNSSGDCQWGDDKKVNVETYANQHSSAAIAIDTNNNIYVTWTDNRNINNNQDEDIYLQKLDTDGNKYTRDYRVNINNDSSSQNSSDMSISNNYPIVVWADNRAVNYDIYFTKFIEYNNPEIASNVNITLVGTKQIGNNPVIFKYDKILNSGISGYINEYEVDSDGSGYTINTDNLLMIDPSSPIKIAPDQIREIMIYVQ